MLSWPATSAWFWLAAAVGGAAVVAWSRRRCRAIGWWAGAVLAVGFGPGVVSFLRTVAAEDPWRLAWWGGGLFLGVLGAALAGWALFWDRPRGRRRCRRCWYDMGASEPGEDDAFTCPECGRRMRSERDLIRTRRRWWWATLAAPMLAGAAALGYTPRALDGQWKRDVPEIAIIIMLPHIGERDKLAEESLNRFLRYGFGRDGRAKAVGGPKAWLIACQAGRALERPAHPTIVIAAIHAISIAGPRAGGSVERLRALTNHPSNAVRETLATQIGMMHLEPAVAADLLRPLLRDPVIEIRNWAADSMARVARRAPADSPLPLPPEVIRFGGGRLQTARREAVLLGLFAATPASDERIAELWGAGYDPTVRAAALGAIARHKGRVSDADARALLEGAMSDADPAVARAAAELLAERGPRDDADLDLLLAAARRSSAFDPVAIYDGLARSPMDARQRTRALVEAALDPRLTDAGVELLAGLARAGNTDLAAVLNRSRADFAAAGYTAEQADAAADALAARARESGRN